MLALLGVVMTGAAATGANLIPTSEELETWEARDGASVTPNVTAAPNGASTADRIQDGASGYPYIGQNVEAQEAGSHVFSCYVKAGEQSQATLRLHNLETKQDLARTTFSLSSSWQRLAVTGSSVSVGDRLRVYLYPGKLGPGSGGIFAWGAQLEAGSSPGAYQKTPAGDETPADTTPPATPTGLSASWTGSAVALKWTANPESDLAGYRVERGTSSTSLSQLASPTTAAHQDSSVAAGNTYYYRIRAADQAGNVSAASSAVSVNVPALPLPPTGGSHFYVAPNGSSSGDGSLTRPWSLQTALAPASAIKPGDTVWLRGGRYGSGGSTVLECRLAGTASAPIIVRQYPGERATLDGGLYAKRGYVWFWGFEITNTSLERTTIESNRPMGLRMEAEGQKAINLVIHNTGRTAVSFHKDVEVYGCIMWGNGLYDANKEGMIRGDAVYANVGSSDPSITRSVRDVISFRNFRHGIKIYSEWSDRYINGFHLEGNVSFNGGKDNFLVTSAPNPIRNLKVLRNYTYESRNDTGATNRLGEEGAINEDAIIAENRWVTGTFNLGALRIKNWKSLQFTDNHVVSADEVTVWERPFTPFSLLWDRNHYFGGDGTPYLINGSSRDFTGWKSLTGVDGNSAYQSSHPSGTEVFVRPNLYETGRGHVVVYNWSQHATVDVDVSGLGLKPGQSFEVVDAQNYFGAPVATGVFDGSKITLPMELVETAPIWGEVTHLPLAHTGREFNVFVVRPLP